MTQEEVRRALSTLLKGSDAEREGAAIELAEMGAPAFQILLLKLNDPDPDQRWWLLRALAGFAVPDASLPLINALSDPDIAVRQCAALGLVAHPNTQAVDPLLAVLQGPDGLLSRLAGQALAAIGASAVPGLLEVFKQGDHRARLEAVKALAEIQDQRAIGPFFEAIRDGDSGLIEYWADIGLDRMGIGMVFFDPN